MKKIQSLIATFIVLLPAVSSAIFVHPEPIQVTKFEYKGSNYPPKVERETFYLDRASLKILSESRKNLSEEDFVALFERLKYNKNKSKEEYHEINIPILEEDFMVFETTESQEKDFFFVIDKFTDNNTYDYYVFNSEDIYNKTKNNPKVTLKYLEDNKLAYSGNVVGGVYATTLAFTFKHKMLKELHFDPYYSTLQHILINQNMLNK